MDFDARFDIMRTAGMLCPENEAIVRRILADFEQRHALQLDESNASGFVSHLCAALERVKKGEAVQTLDDAVYASVREAENYPRARSLAEEILKQTPAFPEAELRFLTMHISVLLNDMN